MTRAAGLLVFALIGALCGCAPGSDPADADTTDTTSGSAAALPDAALPDDVSGDDTAGTDPDDADAIVTTATGRVASVPQDDDFIVLEHDPIDAIGMGAMRMGFEVADGVDMSGLRRGDAVLFRIRATSDDLVLTALCRPRTDGENCLN